MVSRRSRLSHGQHDGPFQMVVHRAKFEGAAAEASELCQQEFSSERSLRGYRERWDGVHLCDVTETIPCNEGKRDACMAMNLEGPRTLKSWGIARKTLP